jgi:uncharacterized protein (TIGR03083 family)
VALTAAGPLDVVEVLRVERARFLDLLRTLDADSWRRPTECPAYDVQGVAAHILGDDFSLLSRQRDGAPPGVFRGLADGLDFRSALDQFNDRWVDTVQFFGPPLLIDLLEATGHWTADLYASVGADTLGEPVGFFAATGPSPYWQIAAREYVERWTHHHQIRRALDRAALDEDVVLLPAIGAVMRAFAAHMNDLGADDGDRVEVAMGDTVYTLSRAGEHWDLYEGADGDAVAAVTVDRVHAATLTSRGIPRDEIAAHLRTSGDAAVANRAVLGIKAMAGR